MAQDFSMPLKGLANGWNSIWVFTLIAMEAVKTYRTNPNFMIGTTAIPTWITPFVLVLFVSALVPNTSFLGHLCGLAFGYGCKLSPHCLGWRLSWLTILGGLGYLKFLAPPEWILRWIEGKLNLLGRLPHYVSVDQKTYGRYGVLPTTNAPIVGSATGDIGLGNLRGSNQRLGPWSTVSYILYFNPCTKTMHNAALGGSMLEPLWGIAK